MLSEYITSFLCLLNVIVREIASKNNLSSSQYFTLHNISSNGIKMSDLSKAIGIDNSTLTRNINILISRLLVSKERSFQDRRQFVVILTSNGEKLVHNIEKQMDYKIESLAYDLDTNHREQLIDIIGKLNWKISCHINEL